MRYLKTTIFIGVCLLVSSALFLFFYLSPEQEKPLKSGKTICLNMIVKDEKDVIERCLTSLLPIIDHWVIVDTGSTDGTQQIIRQFMKKNNVPGELHERPWKNFAHNRNEALQLAKGKGDYVFIIDADEYLVYDPDFKLPKLDKSHYYVTLTSSGMQWKKMQLINNKLHWEYVGVLHEVLSPPPGDPGATLEKVVNIYTTDGARSKDPLKYQKDAALLEAALEDEPDNARYMYYLAQSYSNAGDMQAALEAYTKRAGMIGFYEETYCALLQIALLRQALDWDPETVLESFKRANDYNRSRVEPYYYIASFYRERGEYAKGYQVTSIGLTLPRSKELLGIQEWIYDYGLLLERSICAYWIGKYEECQQLSIAMLNNPQLPPHVRECVQANLGFANAKLLEAAVTN
ncbi:MAG: glycosyltransferase [Verrucomicrobia bacterium]|nr:glycosyltransferase [Verrucomicrobiota bacterium]